MIEGRARIASIDATRTKLEALGAAFRGAYAFTDIIFVPKKAEYNLSDDFVRVRVYIKSSWPTKRAVLVRKQSVFGKIGKTDRIALKKEFDTEADACAFVAATLGAEFERGFAYAREGWHYDLKGRRIFVEDIKGYSPSVEVEADSESEIEAAFAELGVKARMHASMPEVMRRVLAP